MSVIGMYDMKFKNNKNIMLGAGKATWGGKYLIQFIVCHQRSSGQELKAGADAGA